MSTRPYRVMLSSTFKDLKGHRKAVMDAMHRHDMLQVAMETSSAVATRGIVENSLEMVEKADIYVLLVSAFRYGEIRKHELNPNNVSTTELEFDRAVERDLPMCVFVMDEKARYPASEVAKETQASRRKLAAFRKKARNPDKWITADFRTVADLGRKATDAFSDLSKELRQREQAPTTGTGAGGVADTPRAIPTSPAFHAQPPYIPSHHFQGRKRELDLLRSWATSPHDPVLVFEAIGGMGKSMVTWEWTTNHAATDRADWAGRLWYSFYERGADMKDFCVTALAYITGQAPETFKPKPTWDLARQLLERLRVKPYLLVLDGLERVLVAYHRSDAAQVRDEEVEAAESSAGRAPRDCIRPDDGDLLKQLVAAGPSKVLITTRLLPVALNNPSGPLPGVRHVMLTGLDQPDAAAMLIREGIKGDTEAMGRFLDQQFGCHPLVVGIVAGLVVNWLPAPGNFDRWVAAPDGGSAANLTDPDIVKRRTHLLRVAFDGLDPQARELIARIAMIANAAPLDVLEALNPVRPLPPEEVSAPWELDLEGDHLTRRLRGRHAEATSQEQRADLERQIRDQASLLTAHHQAARQARATYEMALAQWRQSQALRDARRWLDSTLADLRARGLLQWDRTDNLFDLHPVVRGYALGILDGEARARAGQYVADLFASRPDPAYRQATGLADLADPIQTIRALNLAGKSAEAWGALSSDLRRAMYRLELHHERLALMQPLFPDGWSAPPVGVERPGSVAAAAALALKKIGLRCEAASQEVFAIQVGIPPGPSSHLAMRLRNHSFTLRDSSNLVGRERVLTLARTVAAVAGDARRALWSDLYQARGLIHQGRLTEARAQWSRLAPDLPDAMRQNRQFEAQARHTAAWLLFREGALTPDHLRATLDRLHALGERSYERGTLALAGEWHRSQGRHTEAIDAFAQAIAMAHEVHLRDTGAEARRGLSLARLGRIQEARDAAASAERDPPHVALASLYLALDQPDQARDHALKGYEWAWANGPPYVWHWELEECRAVLRALNVPEPQLPPYDPAKHQPFPWEADIHRMLEAHAAEQRKEDS